MKEWMKYFVDCALAFGISFLSTTLATSNINLTTIIINVMTGLLIALIKFRDYWQSHLPKSKNTPSIFF